MRLCLTCGCVDEHRDCPLLAHPKTPQEKVQRVQRALGEIDRTIFAHRMAKGPPTIETLLTLLSAEVQLQNFQAKDLTDFGQKRAYNLVEMALKEAREGVESALGDVGSATADGFAYAKRAIELAFRLAQARLDASRFDATPLGALPIHTVTAAKNEGASLASICGEVDALLEETRPIDARVSSWGWKNLTPLAIGKDPADFPDSKVGSGSFAVLGAIVGRGPASRRASAATQFKVLGDELRERLYLLAANPILLRHASAVSQAEEAWRRHTTGPEARWDRMRKAQPELLCFFLGPISDIGDRFDDTIAELARRSRSPQPGGLVPIEDLDPEDWETLARAYFLIYDAVQKESASGEGVVWEPVVRALVERLPGGQTDRLTRQKIVQDVREAWLKLRAKESGKP